MKVQLLGSHEADIFIPMDITNKLYLTEWEGELNEAQLMWVIQTYSDCEIIPWKTFNENQMQVIGLTIALNGFYYG